MINFFEYINDIFKTYAPILDAVDSLFGIVIGVGLFFVAYSANRIAKSNLEFVEQVKKQSIKYRVNKEEREIFRSVYRNLTDALALILKDDYVGHKALNLFLQAHNQAKLELPEDIQEYSRELLECASELFHTKDSYTQIIKNALPKSPEETKTLNRYGDLLFELTGEEPYEHFEKYMRVDTEK